MNRLQFLGRSTACAAALVTAAAAPVSAQAEIELGDDVFLRKTWRDLGGRTVGVITNQSGVTSSQTSIVDAILAQGGIRVKAIYAPEHGFRGNQAAGATVASCTDAQTGLPVYSLYGAARHPTAAMLSGVDVLAVRHPRRRIASVHVHLHHGVRHAERARVRQGVLGARSPESGRRRDG